MKLTKVLLLYVPILLSLVSHTTQQETTTVRGSDYNGTDAECSKYVLSGCVEPFWLPYGSCWSCSLTYAAGYCFWQDMFPCIFRNIAYAFYSAFVWIYEQIKYAVLSAVEWTKDTLFKLSQDTLKAFQAATKALREKTLAYFDDVLQPSNANEKNKYGHQDFLSAKFFAQSPLMVSSKSMDS